MNFFEDQEEARVFRKYSTPKSVYKAFAFAVFGIIFLESPLVLFLISPETVMRVQTLNGLLVLSGGLAWAGIALLFIMLPLIKMTVHMLVVNDKSSKRLNEGIDKLEKTCEKLEKFCEKLEKSYEPDSLRKELTDGVQALKDIRTALTKPIEKPPLPLEAQGKPVQNGPVKEPIPTVAGIEAQKS
jgi:hypothetical protein